MTAEVTGSRPVVGSSYRMYRGRSAIARARELGVETLAIPALGTGVGGFPLAEAARITVAAVRDAAARAPRLQTVTFALRGAAALTDAGLAPGQTCALMLPTSLDFFVAFCAVLAAGGVPVPLYPPVRLGRLDEYTVRTAAMLRAVDAALVLADRRVARLLGEAVAADAPAAHVDAVGAVEVLDPAAVDGRGDLRMVAAHVLALDLQVIVDGAADDQPADPQRALLHMFAVVRDDDPRHHLVGADGTRARHFRQDRRAHAVGARRVLDPLQFLDRGLQFRDADLLALERVRAHQRGVADRVDQPRHAAGVAEDDRVGVLGEDLPAVRAGDLEAVQEAIAPLLTCGAPAATIFPRGLADSVAAAVKARGFTVEAGMPAMAVDIERMAATSLPPGYEWARIGAGDEGRAWVEALAIGYEIPPGLAEIFGPEALGADMAHDAQIQFFSVLRAGRHVATSLLYLDDGLAGIYCVSTLAEERQKGLGAHATAEALRVARQLGFRVGVLQSSEAGHPVYLGLGFGDHASIPMLIRMPG